MSKNVIITHAKAWHAALLEERQLQVTELRNERTTAAWGQLQPSNANATSIVRALVDSYRIHKAILIPSPSLRQVIGEHG
jgi:hypothetical protein